jgi:GNAT superfamily N-acetyltransferase
LAVGREYQNKGIASKLLSMWEEDVLAQGGHNIYLWTYDFNVAFYNHNYLEKKGKAQTP